MQHAMSEMAEGRSGAFFEAVSEEVTWRWMGVRQWSRTFEGKQAIANSLFGGPQEMLPPSSRIVVHVIYADDDVVVVEHSGRNELPDGAALRQQLLLGVPVPGPTTVSTTRPMSMPARTEDQSAERNGRRGTTEPRKTDRLGPAREALADFSSLRAVAETGRSVIEYGRAAQRVGDEFAQELRHTLISGPPPRSRGISCRVLPETLRRA